MILIVDDKPENIFSLKSLLQLHRYEVDTALSGEEALKKILKKEYELIILDVQMPGMDGYEVAENITGYSKSRKIPILFLSAVAIDKRFITKGYASGGIDYVTKPFDADLLLLKVSTFVKLHRQTKELSDIKNNLENLVAERTSALVQANKELEISNAELQQYAYIASHDLQEPLRKIITFSNIIQQKHSGNSEIQEQLLKIISSSERMKTLINDLLNYSKLSVTPSFILTDLNSIVNDTLADLEISIFEKQAKISVDKLEAIEVIPDQMRQAFQNLLSNAIKFSKPNVAPDIRIHGEWVNALSATAPPVDHGNFYRIHISDNGIGFDEIYLDRIFNMFQRLHGRNEYEGTGIGLSIVKKIMDKHNGIITATSQPGEGSNFILVMPATQG